MTVIRWSPFALASTTTRRARSTSWKTPTRTGFSFGIADLASAKSA
jgi:hypothetical protein